MFRGTERERLYGHGGVIATAAAVYDNRFGTS